MGKSVIGMITSYNGMTYCDWLWQQTPHPFGIWENAQMLAQAPNPDFLLIYNFDVANFQPVPAQKPWQRWFKGKQASQSTDPTAKLRGVPKERIIALMREPPFPERLEKRMLDYQEAQKICGYVSGPDDLAPVSEYMPAIWYHANSFRELNEMPPPEKVKPCSWITSGIDRTTNHQKRLAFLKLVAESGLDCDIYGRRLPDWARGNGSLDNKWYAMAPYHYNLAIENYIDNPWYVSEKLWDSLLAWCLPIYYGGPAADKLLPPGSFLRLPSMDEKGLAYIQEVTASPDLWREALPAIAEARQMILHELNLLRWLSNFVAKFD